MNSSWLVIRRNRWRNDGVVFVRYGTVDVPLSWSLRYSHSPAEVIDTRDYDALAKIVTLLAKQW